MREQSCSVFDLDHTLLVDNASYRFGRFLYAQGFLPLIPLLKLTNSYLLQRYALITPLQLHQHAIRVYFSKQPKQLISDLAKAFCRLHLDKSWYLPAIARWKAAKQSGQLVLLLSSSPDFIVEPIAKQLEADEWHATTYSSDSKGYFWQASRVLDGEGKKTLLLSAAQRCGFSLHQVAAYSDSILDLPLLSSVGKPVAVRPDKPLLRHCRAHGWQVI